MDGERCIAVSNRILRLTARFHDKQYRDAYVAAHTREVLAKQMRSFRGDLPQAEFAVEIGKQKTVVARLENPAYSGWSIRTMLEIARNRDVAVFCRFVDFPTFLKLTSDLSDAALYPAPYNPSAIDQLVDREGFCEQEQALKALFSPPDDTPPPPKALEGMQGNNVPRARLANDDDTVAARNSVLSALS